MLLPADKPRSSISQRVIAAGIILGFLYLAGPLVMTIVVSILLASTLDPAVRLMTSRGIPRGLAAMTMVLVLLGVGYLGFYLFYAQAINFAADLPKALGALREHVLHFRQKATQFERQTEAVISPRETEGPDLPPDEYRTASSLEDMLGVGWKSVSEVLVLSSFVPFLVYFFLTWKSHLRRNAVFIVSGENRVVAERTIDGITRMIHGFVVGNVIIGLILSVVSGLFFWRVGLHYSVFLGPISGFLSLVPYFGVVLALVPPFVVGLAQYNTTVAPLVVLLAGVVILHLIALNVLYPKIVGSRVHLNPVIVTLAIMFWGWLWGGMGLILAVPITAAMKAVCDNISTLRPYGRFLGD
jgi:predicted PurR-regulated permease PerM